MEGGGSLVGSLGVGGVRLLGFEEQFKGPVTLHGLSQERDGGAVNSFLETSDMICLLQSSRAVL